MFDEPMLKDLNQAFKRIFAMPITRSTFRELQNAVMTVSNGDVQTSNALFESLLTGEAKKNVVKNTSEKDFQSFIDHYGVSTRTARDVFEKGEFISLITTDILTRQNLLVFLTRIRRVDGEEIQFITDPEGTINLMQHLTGRLGELNRNQQTAHIMPNYRAQLETLRNSIDKLMGGSAAPAAGTPPASEQK